MRQILLSCVFLLAIFFVSPALVEACSCIGSGAPCQSFWNTDVVFSGQVTDIRDTPVKAAVKSGGDADSDFRNLMFRTKTVRLAVNEAFRGTEEKVLEIETGLGGGDCGFAFETGQSYLIYAYRNKETGRLGTGICTRTQLLSKATEDLEYFRSLKDAKAGGTVYGKVMKYFVRKSGEEYKPNPPLPNIRLTFLGNGGSYEVLTDEKGEYRISNLAAGEYKMNVEVPKGMWGFEKEETIKIPDKGCAQTYTALETKTFLGGKIQTDDAVPLKDIGVNLIPVEQINERYQRDSYSAFTDAEGRYLFKEVPAGTYYLGVRLNRVTNTNFPFPRTFYPGTTDLKNAVPVTIVEGQVIENFDIALGKKLVNRKISGVVLTPDGKPAARANVCLEEVEYAEGSICQNGIESNDKGQFTLTAPDNLRFLVRAFINIQNGEQRHAEPFEVTANGDVSNVKLVITEAGGSCEKCRNWKRNKK